MQNWQIVTEALTRSRRRGHHRVAPCKRVRERCLLVAVQLLYTARNQCCPDRLRQLAGQRTVYGRLRSKPLVQDDIAPHVVVFLPGVECCRETVRNLPWSLGGSGEGSEA